MDYDLLKEDLMDYYGSAMITEFPMAVVELSEIESASNLELVKLAKKAGIDLNKYKDK